MHHAPISKQPATNYVVIKAFDPQLLKCKKLQWWWMNWARELWHDVTQLRSDVPALTVSLTQSIPCKCLLICFVSVHVYLRMVTWYDVGNRVVTPRKRPSVTLSARSKSGICIWSWIANIHVFVECIGVSGRNCRNRFERCSYYCKAWRPAVETYV